MNFFGPPTKDYNLTKHIWVRSGKGLLLIVVIRYVLKITNKNIRYISFSERNGHSGFFIGPYHIKLTREN